MATASSSSSASSTAARPSPTRPSRPFWSTKVKTALVLLSVLVLGPKPVPAKVAEVLRNPAEFDHKSISVKGAVEDFRARTSQAGHDYTTFDLVDGKQKLPIFLANKLENPPKDGDKVTVTGKFEKEKKVGSLTFKNEIDASAKLDKAFGVKKQ